MVKLIAYDLDGTLVDSALVVTTLLNQMRMEAGKPSLIKEQLLPWLSLGGEDLISKALNLADEKNIYLCLKEFRRRYELLPTPSTSLYPNTLQTLERLRSSGYELAVCTNKPRNLATKVLDELGLMQYFEYLSAGGDLVTKKPAPQNLQVCLDFFKVKPFNSVLVGDSTIDQRIAKASKVHFVHYEPGYNDGVDSADIAGSLWDHADIFSILKSIKLSLK